MIKNNFIIIGIFGFLLSGIYVNASEEIPENKKSRSRPTSITFPDRIISGTNPGSPPPPPHPVKNPTPSHADWPGTSDQKNMVPPIV